VFIRVLVDADGLAELVEREEGFVHVKERDASGGSRFPAILTEPQRQSREERDRQIDRLLGGSSAETPTYPIEDVAEMMDKQAESHLVAFVRPRTKKALRAAVKTAPGTVFLEETSAFGNEFEGWLDEAPKEHYTVVGPDPGRHRNWFAGIRWSTRKNAWTVD
jgi:hypothetical protein